MYAIRIEDNSVTFKFAELYTSNCSKKEKGEKIMKKLASMTLLAMIALSTVAIFPAFALPADSMWTTPTAINGNTVGGYGQKFNVTIWLNVTTMTNSWQFYLIYNSAQLNAVRTDYTGSGKSLWSAALPCDTVAPSYGSHNATFDYVVFGEVLKGSAEKTGDNSLAWVEFQIMQAPGKYATLSSEIRLDVVGTFNSYAQDKLFQNIPLTYGKSDYTYAWIQPAAPNLSIGPDQTYGPAPPSAVGQTFTETLKIDSISADWGLHNATVDITGINTSLIEGTSFTKGAIWNNFVFDNTTTPGQIHIEVWNPSSTPSGLVIIGTLGFRVKDQGPFGKIYKSFFNLASITLWDTTATIGYGSLTNATVTVNGLQLLPNAYLQVSSATLGPGPAIGELFTITVSLKDLDKGWFAIGLDFRLSYDPYYITPVAIDEGPMLPYFAALQPGSIGTWFIGIVDNYPPFGPHTLVGDLILPNGTGRWNRPFPNSTATDPIVAYITFRVEYQSFGDPNQTSPLNIIDSHLVGLVNPDAEDQDIVYLPLADPHNGTYTITTVWPGRMIDVYTQYPAPFGGQGLGMPSDMFWPQKQVDLYANVTYNYWPVQQKDVAFEIRDPHNTLWAVLVARTDTDGVAHTSFRIPWPCDHPEELFGVWTVVATVDVSCIVVNDTLQFHFDYLVNIFKVTTDKFEYNHCDKVYVTIDYGTHAQQIYPLVLYVVIKDNCDVPIGIALISTTIGGTQFCTYKNYTDLVSIHIDKFAFAGIATILVTAYNKLPAQGGNALCPTFGDGWPIGATIPEIAIQPY